MLTGLLAALAAKPSADLEREQLGSYLRQFSRWCQALGLTAPPTSTEVIHRYLVDQVGNDAAHLRAVDLAYEVHEQTRPSQRADLEEVIALLGLREPHLASYQLASAQAPATQQLYQRRIARFARWCARHHQTPSASSVERWLDSIQAKGPTRSQYRTSIHAWSEVSTATETATSPTVDSKPVTTTESKPGPAASRRLARPMVLRTAEKRLIYQLGRTGVAEHHRHALTFAKVRPQRLKALIRAGYILEHRGLTRLRPGQPLRTVRYYSLGGRGRAWLKCQGVKHLYRWNPQQLRHDLHLTDAYCQLPPAVQRTWITETEVIEQLQAQRRYAPGEAVDAAIVLNGQPYAIEIAIGYSRAAIAKKQACIRDVFDGRGLLVT